MDSGSINKRQRGREKKGQEKVLRVVTYFRGTQTLSGYEGSQAVPAFPCSRGGRIQLYETASVV
jgi:hypothetical protein